MNRLNVGDHVGPYRITNNSLEAYEAVRAGGSHLVIVEVFEGGTEVGVRIAAAARLLGAIRHPGIASIVDYGLLSDDGRPWMASVRAIGPLLHDMLVGRSLRADKVAELIRDIADVLRFAHANSVVHGRLRAHSIVVTTQGVSISGWGVGVDRERSVYDAPEARASAKADVYALGVIAYRALTGQFPRGCLTSPFQTMNVPGAPPALAKLIVEMTAPDPARRPSAADVREAIAEMLGESQPVEVISLDEIDDADFAPNSELPRSRPKWTPPTHLAPFVPVQPNGTPRDEDFDP